MLAVWGGRGQHHADVTRYIAHHRYAATKASLINIASHWAAGTGLPM